MYYIPMLNVGERVNCAGQYCATHFLMDYLSELRAYSETPIFSFMHDFSYTGDSVMAGGGSSSELDQLYSDQMRRRMGNTFVVLVADHGLRFGAMARVAYFARHDLLNPLLVLVAPCSSLDDRAVQLLGENQQRLVTIKDLHKTLTMIPVHLQQAATTPGLPSTCIGQWCDLMYSAVPDNRSCSDAGISPLWCAQNEPQTLTLGPEERRKLLDQMFLVMGRKVHAHLDRCHMLQSRHFFVDLAEGWPSIEPPTLDILAMTVKANESLFATQVDQDLSFQAIFQDDSYSASDPRFAAGYPPVVLRRVSAYLKEPCHRSTDDKILKEFCVCRSGNTFTEV